MNTTICLMAVRISETTAIRLSHMQQIVGSLVGIGTLCYFVFQRQKMPKLLGSSTKVLIWWMIAFVLIHNIFLCIVAIWHEVRFYIYSDGCDLLIRTWQCLFFRVPTITSIIGMSAVYMVLLIDRLCSICLPNHYCNEKAPVAISTGLVLFVSTLSTLMFYDEDLLSFKHYCVSTSSQNARRLTVLYAFLFCSHITCTLGFVLILRHSSHLLKRNKHNFVVSEKLKLRVDIVSMRFMMAGTICSFIFIGMFLCANFLFRQIIEFENFIARSSWINGFYSVLVHTQAQDQNCFHIASNWDEL
ncbi:serpentine type 7TM GPCR receptor class ab chemoreceptor domain-containing protein [Ditylenchus destructor]|uniref:Serpentine type 7TM GPCR receptor class ab chemoreceptor domain-containing protein n=1 Tax=Ditylenchus destructor TaxID=166010 RepID=A0AAD4MSH8_9BILA|nr:serpentine type 7TM GPCR receptor class ab chemoreceptor domain-containing protein [Ditylenchus destructor]